MSSAGKSANGPGHGTGASAGGGVEDRSGLTPSPARSSRAPLKTRVLRVDAAGVLCCGALAAAAYFFGVQPVFDARSDVEETRRLIEEQTRNAEDVEQRLTNARTKQQVLQRQLAATSVKLSHASDINRRLAIISDLVDKHGLEIRSLDPGAPVTDPAVGKFSLVPIRLAGVGSFPAVAAFMHELLTEGFADMEVRTLSLSAAPASPVSAAAGNATKGSAFVGPPGPENGGAFSMELRWYAAPAASAASASDESQR